METAVEARNLGKQYVLRHQTQGRYTALRDVLTEGAVRVVKRALGRPGASISSEEVFWALSGVSFSIRQGERVGIIGRNGAGKSTLLKILSRITEPSAGRVAVRGRVASLLEVGTGFHPELTGRENIYLNGAILGMAKAEIARKFDEIVAFAEVERFLDTPVKRYSSGMYVRLAFSVAAHLEADILVVDEVLAVGDVQFQKKCLGRMEQVAQSGRTVLFVSHNMATITSLCDRCILLDAGKVAADGLPSDVILRYYAGGSGSSPASFDTAAWPRQPGDEHARLLGGAIEDCAGRPIYELDLAHSFEVSMRYRILSAANVRSVPNFHFFRADGSYAFVASMPGVEPAQPGEYVAKCKVPAHLLNDGGYFVGLALTSYSDSGYAVNFYEQSALSFNVRDPMDDSSNRYGYGGAIPGVVRPRLAWSGERVA
jgi:lipopolysaccharide transport system ATP-binding protein